LALSDDLNSLLQPNAPILREFGDYPTTRKNIFDNVYKAVASKFPLQNSRYTVELQDLAYGRNEDYSLAEQQEAIMQNKSLFFPLRGKLIMKDNAT